MVYKISVIVIWLPHLPMFRVGTQFQCAVFLTLLILAPFYCVEESEFDIESDGIDASNGIDPERLLEMVPLSQQIQPISQEQSAINEQRKKKLMLEYSRPTYPESKHSWQTYLKTTHSGQKYSKPTNPEPKNLEPTYSRQTKSKNLKPKYPILFSLLKKHLLRSKNELSIKSSDLKELVDELEARLSNTPSYPSLQKKVENKQTSSMYSNRNDEEEQPGKRDTTTKKIHKFIRALLTKLNRPSTEKYFKTEEPLDYATPGLIATGKRDLKLSSNKVKYELETKFNNITKHPKTQTNIKNEPSMYSNQMYWEDERKVEKELKKKNELPTEKINYLSTEKYSNTVTALEFINPELITTANIALPLSAKEVDNLEILKQNKIKEVINEHTSPAHTSHNSWEDEREIEQTTKSHHNMLRQEKIVFASSTPKQMRESWEFIAQELIPTVYKDLQWWSEDVDEREVDNTIRKLLTDAKDIKKVKDEQKLNSKNGKEQSDINLKNQSSKLFNNEITKEDIDDVLLKDAPVAKFPRTTESLKYVTEKPVTIAEEVSELDTKSSSTHASTEVNTKRENEIEQTPVTEPFKKYWTDERKKEKELHKEHSIEYLSYDIFSENLVKNSSIVKHETDSLESGTQEITQVNKKRGAPLMKNLDESDEDDNTVVGLPKTSISRRNSSWKEFLKDLEKEQQFFYEEPFELSGYSYTEAKNLTNMKVNRQDKNKGKYNKLSRNTPTGILGQIMKVSRNLLLPDYILSLLNFDVSEER